MPSLELFSLFRVFVNIFTLFNIFDGKAGRKLSVKVYNSRTVNAFALPDGSIRIDLGLIKELGENRTRAVLGHEVGLVILDHSQDRMRHSILVSAGGKAANRKKLHIYSRHFTSAIAAKH